MTKLLNSEEEVLAFWENNCTFKRSVEARDEKNSFVFYDGPPFATGLPHYGHLVASTLKDVVPRYQTMKGKRVERRFGWDTHGLPVEVLVEKKLGLSGPASVRAFGVDNFNEECRANVLTYVKEWRKTVTRLGRWVDFDNDYKTMDLSYMESVWWVWKQLWDKGLTYCGPKVMPYSWKLGTVLSNSEATEDYRQVNDPAVTVSFPLNETENLLVWTTTAWTLPANLAVAVNPEMDYVKFEKDNKFYWVAKELSSSFAETFFETKQGKDFVGLSYSPPFDFLKNHPGAFKVFASNHVNSVSGTGFVHLAPAYGEEDFLVCQKNNLDAVDLLDASGNYLDGLGFLSGRNFKEAEKDLLNQLKASGVRFKLDQVNHSYPHCSRSNTPLMYKLTKSWYVKVSALKERMMELNKQVRWVPEEVGSHRFHNWLADAHDWSVSRSRFWGTPMPVWVAEDGEHLCVGSVKELEELTGQTVTDLHPHFVDKMSVVKNGKVFTRVPFVFDCWFESGSMPYAQVHYPFENEELFEKNFGTAFLAEGTDQTRGWFYTLSVLSTALFDKPAFANVVVNGHVLADDGQKMSKSKNNYVSPVAVLESFGADALRLYLMGSGLSKNESLKFNSEAVKLKLFSVVKPLNNSLDFFRLYAGLDGWTYSNLASAKPVAERSMLDRWLMAKTNELVGAVTEAMDQYELYKVVPLLEEFANNLTNWYVRLSRETFWGPGLPQNKLNAYASLCFALETFAKVCAPLTPFLAEKLWHNTGDRGNDSVHLQNFPEFSFELEDKELLAEMELVSTVVKAGRYLREVNRLKTKQPLSELDVLTSMSAERLANYSALVKEELSVHQVNFMPADSLKSVLSAVPNWKTLGASFKSKAKALAEAVVGLSSEQLEDFLVSGKVAVMDCTLDSTHLQVNRTYCTDKAVQKEKDVTVLLNLAVTTELYTEGLYREVGSVGVALRKQNNASPAQKFNKLYVYSYNADFKPAVEQYSEQLKVRLQADQVLFDEAALSGTEMVTSDGTKVWLKFV